jgi:hypothetical protein
VTYVLRNLCVGKLVLLSTWMTLLGIRIQHQSLKDCLLWKGQTHCKGWFYFPGDFLL